MAISSKWLYTTCFEFGEPLLLVVLITVLSSLTAIPAGQVYLTELTPTGIGQVLSSPSLNAPALPLTGYHIETGFFTANTGTKRKLVIYTTAEFLD